MKCVRQNLKEIISLSLCGHMLEQIQFPVVDYEMGTLERLTFLTGTLLRSCCFQAERFVRHYLAAFWSWIVLVESSRFLTSSYYEGVVEAGYFTFYRRLSSGYSGPHCSSLSFSFFLAQRLFSLASKRKRLENNVLLYSSNTHTSHN